MNEHSAVTKKLNKGTPGLRRGLLARKMRELKIPPQYRRKLSLSLIWRLEKMTPAARQVLLNDRQRLAEKYKDKLRG
jgi:hypothetical protein